LSVLSVWQFPLTSGLSRLSLWLLLFFYSRMHAHYICTRALKANKFTNNFVIMQIFLHFFAKIGEKSAVFKQNGCF